MAEIAKETGPPAQITIKVAALEPQYKKPKQSK